MLEDITTIDLKILSLFTKDYSAAFSIRQITKLLDINYPHAFRRIKKLMKDEILLRSKFGQATSVTLNIKNIAAVQLLSFVEEQESRKIKNTDLQIIAKEAINIDPFSCTGLFGSRVSGKAAKDSDWDVFIICQKDKRKEMEKIMAKLPYARNIQLQVFSIEEFQESLISSEETVIKHIIKNKQIIYNPHPFYSIMQRWEMIRYAPK